MLKGLRKKIESKRHSKNAFWQAAVTAKDFLWKLWRLQQICLKRPYFALRRAIFNAFKKGKLPDFLIIGMQKAGTTYLWKTLKKHPCIQMSPNFFDFWKGGYTGTKEVNFFRSKGNWSKGINWYKSLFINNKKIQGEADPDYIWRKECHEKMFAVVPEAKLILLLRNPVKRAHSAFCHMERSKKAWHKAYDLNKSFRENIELDIKSGFLEGGMIKIGFYIDQIKNLLKYYPKNQLLIIITEQMKDNPEDAYNKVCQFLKIKNDKINLREEVHMGYYNTNIDKATEKKLYEIYEPYNQQLYKFLGHEIKEWEDEKP